MRRTHPRRRRPRPRRQKEPAAFAEKSRLAGRLARRQWVATVELVPPRGYDLSTTVAKSKALHERGVDAINIPDGPRARRGSRRW